MPIDCMFKFPKYLNTWRTCVKMCEIITDKEKNYQLHYEINIVPKRNYRWLESHPIYSLESWQANIDFQLTLDIDKVLRHMTKHVTKCEHAMTKCITAMTRSTLRKTIADGLIAQTSSKRVMVKTLGQRTLSK